MNNGVLSDQNIRAEYLDDSCSFDIDPFDSDNVQPASYDLTLGSEFQREPDGDRPRMAQSVRAGPADRRTVIGGSIEIQPGEFVLGHTKETINLPHDITAEVKGRSSVGRLGLIPHTAGWIDPGFEGQITLEFVNHSKYPVVVDEGMRCAQIVFSYTATPSDDPYGSKDDSKYQGQTGVTSSRIGQDSE